MTLAALVTLYCLAGAPPPLVGSDAHRALRGEAVAAAPAPQAIADAVRGARHRRRHP